MLARRLLAFELNIARLMLSQCHMWTFTLKGVWTPREAARHWSNLLQLLKKYNPGWSGIRVFELHPGKWDEFSHGLHVHLVSTNFYSDKLMHSIIRGTGLWGRWDRTMLLTHAGAMYIGKYLRKKRPPALHGMRLQSCFGDRDYTRIRDVMCECMRGRVWKQLAREIPSWSRLMKDGGIGWTRKNELVAHECFRIVDRGLVWHPEYRAYVVYGPQRIPPDTIGDGSDFMERDGFQRTMAYARWCESRCPNWENSNN